MAMVAQVEAARGTGSDLSGDDVFWLTAKGARAALLPREKLAAEDFPHEPV
jgi:hypothetical protein